MTSYAAPRRYSELQPASTGAAGSGTNAAAVIPVKRDATSSTERGSDRKRLKKLDDAFDAETGGAYFARQVLSAPYLTETVWTQIFDIYRLHFATELPFLHMPTLKEELGDKFKTNQARHSADTHLVLLGVLTLTSRFHPDLVKYIYYAHSKDKSRDNSMPKMDPWAASEFYADALTKALGPLRSSLTTASVGRVQAFLMLGLYEWSQSKRNTGGMSAWMYVGIAIRMAQAIGLCFGGKYDHVQLRTPEAARTTAEEAPEEADAGPGFDASSSNPLPNDYLETSFAAARRQDQPPHPAVTTSKSPMRRATLASRETPSQTFIKAEISRRTMFSCLVLDRMLACGKQRMPAIRARDIRIQLPCSDVAFDLGEPVYTGFLKSLSIGNGDVSGDVETKVNHDSLLARFVCLVDIWGEISQYSFAGGRHAEKRPPWEETEFRRLRAVLDDFYAALPSAFILSTGNYHKHENQNASSVYVSLHMLGAVCQIMLHREYIPFIPLRCTHPMGPLDEPTFPEDSAPTGFWEESAEQVFKAARNIVDLIEICEARDKMPKSALVVFSIWTAAFVGIYAWHFPQLDVERHMLGSFDGGHSDGRRFVKPDGEHALVTNYGPTGVSFDALVRMSSWLQMACEYVKYFREMDNFYEGVKKDYWRQVSQSGRRIGTASVRLGGDGGGLEEWTVHGPKVTNNGKILVNGLPFGEAVGRSRASSIAGGPDTGQTLSTDSIATTANSGPHCDTSSSLHQNRAHTGGSRDLANGNRHMELNNEGALQQPWMASSAFASARVSTTTAGQLHPGEEERRHLPAVSAGIVVLTSAPPSSIGDSAAAGYANNGFTIHGTPAHDSAVQSPLQQCPTYGQLWSLQQERPHNFHPQIPLGVQHQAEQPFHTPTLLSPDAGYLYDGRPDGYDIMAPFYRGLAEVEQYVIKHQGMRWQDASQAAGIEQFSYGELTGPAVWTDQHYNAFHAPLASQAYGLQ